MGVEQTASVNKGNGVRGQFQEMLEEIPPGQVIVRTITNYTGYIVDIYFYNIIILV